MTNEPLHPVSDEVIKDDPDQEKRYPKDKETVWIWTRNRYKESPEEPDFIWFQARYNAYDHGWYVETDSDAYWVHDSEVVTWKPFAGGRPLQAAGPYRAHPLQ